MDKDKKEFIWKKGVVGAGLPVALMMSVLTAFQAPGSVFRIQRFDFHTFLISLAIFVPIFMIAGYFWGIFVYRYRKNR